MNEPGSHFIYNHLPSSGMEVRDPLRPYVSGGLGRGIPIFVTKVLEEVRKYLDKNRDARSGDRGYLDGLYRQLLGAERILVGGPDEPPPLPPKYMTFDDTINTFVSTPDANISDADTAHLYQGEGTWQRTGISTNYKGDLRRAEAGLFGGHYASFTASDTTTANSRLNAHHPAHIPVTEGDVFTISALYRTKHTNPSSGDLVLSPEFFENAAYKIGLYHNLDSHYSRSETWQRFSRTFTVPSGLDINEMSLLLGLFDNTPAEDDYFEVAELTIEEGVGSGLFIPSNRINGKLRLEGKFRLKEYSKGVSYQRIIQRYGAAPNSGWLSYFDYNLPDAYQSIGTYDGNVHHLRNGPRPGAPAVRFEDGVAYETAVWVDPRTGDWGMERPLGNEYFTDNTGDTWVVDYVPSALLVGLETDGDVYWWKVYDDDLLVQEFNANDLDQDLGPIVAGTTWSDSYGRVWTATGDVVLGAEEVDVAIYGIIAQTFDVGAIPVPFGVSSLINVVQTVTLPATEITGLGASLRVNAGAPTEDVYLDLYTWDGVSDPDSGTLVATVTIPSSEITGTFQSLRGNTSVRVDAGQYAIVYRSATSDTDYYATESNGFGSYSGGSEWRNLFGTWGELPGNDLVFAVWGQTGTVATDSPGGAGRSMARLSRAIDVIGRHLQAIGRTMASRARSMRSGDRDLD